MTEHEPGDVVMVVSDNVQIHVTDDIIPTSHSFKTVTKDPDRDGVTVTLRGGQTYVEYGGDVFVFEGVRYFTGRNDGLSDGTVDMVARDGFPPDEGHPLNPIRSRFTLSDLADMLDSGTIEPARNPNITHD